MRASKITKELSEEIRAEYSRPGVTWRSLGLKHKVSTSRLYQMLEPRRYWLSVRRRADRELKKLNDARQS